MQKLSSKLINNSYLGVYKIYKVLEKLKLTSYDEIKNKKDIPAFVYNLYDKLKNEFNVKTDAQLQDELNNDPKINDNVKQILNTYFDSALGIKSDIKTGDLLDSVFIYTICKGFEYKSHLHYKFAGIFTYQDFELPKMDPKQFVEQLIKNLKPIYIEKEELDTRITKGFGIDDKVDNIKLLKKYAKISQLGFVLNTCHNYSPGQHWVAMCMQLLESNSKKKHFKLFYYDSQMTAEQQQTIGFQLETLDCECFPNCPSQYHNYTPKIKEWLQKLADVLNAKSIQYHTSSKSAVKVYFNKINTQDDDYSCGYHAILFNYLMAMNGESLNSIQASLKSKSNLDSIISSFRELIVRKQGEVRDEVGQSGVVQTSDVQTDNIQKDNIQKDNIQTDTSLQGQARENKDQDEKSDEKNLPQNKRILRMYL